MRTPRDLSGKEVIKALRIFGYIVVRQNGSHIMVTSNLKGEHHLAIPNHSPIKIGTLNGVVGRVAAHFQLTKDEVMHQLFG